MGDAKCKHLDAENLCHGLYDGFGCIGDKCKDETAGPATDACAHMRGDGYCVKLNKIFCAGKDDCADFAPL